MTANAVGEALRNFNPDACAALERFEELAFPAVDRDLLELVRMRIAMLLGDAAELARVAAEPTLGEKIRNLPEWPKSALFSDAERACLDYAEQYVIDVSGMTDDHAQALLRHFTVPEIFAFAHAVYLIDAAQRTNLVLGRVLEAFEGD